MSRFAIVGVHVPAVVSAAPRRAVQALGHEPAPAWAVKLRSGAPADVASIELPKGRYRLTAALACRAERVLSATLRASVGRASATVADTPDSRYQHSQVSTATPFTGRCLPMSFDAWTVKVDKRQRYYLAVEGVFTGFGAAALSVIGHLSAERV